MCSDTSSTVVPARRIRGWFGTTELILRFLLAALAVLICYCLRWEFLRFLTMELNLRLDAIAGVHLQRIAFDTVLWNGQVYHYAIACTMADVWCAAIPLVWDVRSKLLANLRYLAVFTVALFAFNIFRLSVSDALVAAGLSWNLGHNVVSGIAYFAIWKVVWRRIQEVTKYNEHRNTAAEDVGTGFQARPAERSSAFSD